MSDESADGPDQDPRLVALAAEIRKAAKQSSLDTKTSSRAIGTTGFITVTVDLDVEPVPDKPADADETADAFLFDPSGQGDLP